MSKESDLIQSAEELRAANQGAAQSAGDLTAKYNALSQATSAAAKSLSTLAGGLASGRTELTQLNQIYEFAGQAAGRLSRTLGDLGSKIPIVGGFLQALGNFGEATVRAASQAVQSLNTQLATVQKQFQTFGTIGALSAQGMSSLQDQMIASGMTMEGFQATVLENSQALAAFAGTTSEGVQKFSQIIGAITTDGLGDELRNIGMSADMIGQAAAGFLARETRQGRAQAMNQEQLTKGAVEYAKQLDMLARLTGQSADQIRRQQDAALSESRFRASIYELDEAAQQRVLNAQSMFARAPQVAQGIRDLVSGVGNTDAALKLVSLTGGEAADAVEKLKSGQISEYQFREQMNDMLRRNIKMFADNAKYAEGSSEAFGDFAQILDLVNENVTGTASAAKGQAELSKTTDALTASTVSAQKSMEQFSRTMQQIALAFMPLVAALNNKATETLANIANTAAGAVGSSTRVRVNPGGRVQVLGSNNANVPLDSQGRPPPAGIQQNAAELQSIMGNRPQLDLGSAAAGTQGLLQFMGGESGTQDAFDDLDPSLRAAVRQAAAAFRQGTGQSLQITSARRTREQQERLYNNYILGFSQIPAAPPGGSPHETGLAVDINNYQAAMRYLNAAGLRQTVAGDPVHFQLGMANGGVVSGPASGYAATLHGTEAVVPLPDGRTIPVQTANSDQSPQLERLDTIVALMREQTENSRRLVSYAS